MKYFLHDCNSFNDDKVSELFLNFGYEGLGLFYTILERIGAQEKPIKTIVLKSQLKVGKKLDKCWSFMEEIGLISSKNGDTFNERILSYSETYQIKKEKNREKILQWREKQVVTENVTSYEPVCNPPKVNESKVNVIKEESNREKVAPPVDLSKSNLFRQPVIPKIERVIESFCRKGGTKEMAEKFFEDKEGTGWFYKGSPITNFEHLVGGFIESWKRIDNKGSSYHQPKGQIINHTTGQVITA